MWTLVTVVFSFWLVTVCAVFATALPSLFSQSTVLHGHPSNVPIVFDFWHQPMDFIFTTPPSAMTCYDKKTTTLCCFVFRSSTCPSHHPIYNFHIKLTSIKASLAVPYPYLPQDGNDLWPRDDALQRFGALLPSRGPRTHSHRAGAAGGVRALRSRRGVGGLEGAWGGWFWDGFEMVLLWFLECFDPDGRWGEFHLESWGCTTADRTIFEPMSLRSKRQPSTFNVGMADADPDVGGSVPTIMQDVRWQRTQSQRKSTYVMSYDDLTHRKKRKTRKTLDCDVIEYTTCVFWIGLHSTGIYWTTYGNFSSWFLILDFNHIRDKLTWHLGEHILELPGGLYGLERIPSIHVYI